MGLLCIRHITTHLNPLRIGMSDLACSPRMIHSTSCTLLSLRMAELCISQSATQATGELSILSLSPIHPLFPSQYHHSTSLLACLYFLLYSHIPFTPSVTNMKDP